MARLTTPEFVDYLRRSKLVADEDLERSLEKYREERGGELPGNAVLVAILLIEAGLITRWHADKIFDKKYKGFYLGKYKLLSHLGYGEMSSVYLAEHVLMKRLRAIKVLPKSRLFQDNDSHLHLFHLEAQAAAALDHPNLVRTFDVDNDGYQHYFVMEYVDGKTLQTMVAESGSLPLDLACNLIAQAAEGLDHAHRHGVIHCDIKPANLMVDRQGTVRVLDMGLALHVNSWRDSLASTHGEQIAYTANYLSPEQALDSHHVDLRTDIYNLGCTLYFLLTGHPPFSAGSFVQKIALHMRMMPVDVSQDRPDCPEDLSAICRRMLQKNPDLRYQNMREVIDALEFWLTTHDYKYDRRVDGTVVPKAKALDSKARWAHFSRGSKSTMSNFKSADEEFPLPARPRISSGRMVMGCLGVTLLVLVAAVAIPWMMSNRQAAARLNGAVQRVKARGEPITKAELNDYYQPAKGRPDMTKEIMAALAICEAAGKKPSAPSLPIVGQGAEPPPRGQPWGQLAEAEKYLADQQAAIQTFHEVARRDGTARFPVDFSPGIATMLPETQRVREGARALSLQFHVHLHKDEISPATSCILAQIALARALEREPTLVSQLVQLAIHGMALEHAQSLVRQAEVSDADLLRLQAHLRRIDLKTSLKSGLVGERTICYTACMDPQQMAEVMGTPSQGVTRELAERQPRRIFDAAKMLEMNLQITEGADESIFEARKEALAAEDEIEGLAGNLVGRLYYTMTMLLTPAYSSTLNAFARASAQRDSADAAIAAEFYRRQNGKWPAKLDDLVPEFLPAAPTDPFTNRPLVMKAAPGSFKVYSVGADGVDHGGNLNTDQKPGTDLGFEMPVR